jgi:hypothetical protein
MRSPLICGMNRFHEGYEARSVNNAHARSGGAAIKVSARTSRRRN